MAMADEILNLLKPMWKGATASELKAAAWSKVAQNPEQPLAALDIDSLHKRLPELERKGKIVRKGTRHKETVWDIAPVGTPPMAKPKPLTVTPLSVGKSPKATIHAVFSCFNVKYSITEKWRTDERAALDVVSDNNKYKCIALAVPGGWVLTEMKQV